MRSTQLVLPVKDPVAITSEHFNPYDIAMIYPLGNHCSAKEKELLE